MGLALRLGYDTVVYSGRGVSCTVRGLPGLRITTAGLVSIATRLLDSLEPRSNLAEDLAHVQLRTVPLPKQDIG